MQVASFLTGWLIFWMCIGTAVASFAFGHPWTGTVNGFLFTVSATFAQPWIMPKFIDDWMDDSYAPTWQFDAGYWPVSSLGDLDPAARLSLQHDHLVPKCSVLHLKPALRLERSDHGSQMKQANAIMVPKVR